MMTLTPGAYIKKMEAFWEENSGVTGINFQTDNGEEVMVGKKAVGRRAEDFYKHTFPFDTST